jgi:hypothetical protein
MTAFDIFMGWAYTMMGSSLICVSALWFSSVIKLNLKVADTGIFGVIMPILMATGLFLVWNGIPIVLGIN